VGSAIWSILRETASRGPPALADILVLSVTMYETTLPRTHGKVGTRLIHHAHSRCPAATLTPNYRAVRFPESQAAVARPAINMLV